MAGCKKKTTDALNTLHRRYYKDKPERLAELQEELISDHVARKTKVRIPKNRAPSHPGEILLKDFLEPMNISQRELSAAIRVPYQRVNELVNGKRGITPSTALRLSAFFGNSSEFWLNLQQAWELYHVMKAEEADLKSIPRFKGK